MIFKKSCLIKLQRLLISCKTLFISEECLQKRIALCMQRSKVVLPPINSMSADRLSIFQVMNTFFGILKGLLYLCKTRQYSGKMNNFDLSFGVQLYASR